MVKPFAPMEAKLFGEFLFHCFNSSVYSHECHDTESNDGNGNACAEFITSDCSK